MQCLKPKQQSQLIAGAEAIPGMYYFPDADRRLACQVECTVPGEQHSTAAAKNQQNIYPHCIKEKKVNEKGVYDKFAPK
jgi:hypothetical protein